MGKEILTYGDIKTEKDNVIKALFFRRCGYSESISN